MCWKTSIRVLLATLTIAGSTSAHAVDARSAQGDCQSEAQRRGYQVIKTSNFQQLPSGWRLDMLVRYRNGRTDSGTCVVDTRTGRIGFHGFDAGGGSGPQTLRFRCESQDGRYRECQIPIDGEVRRLPRLSEAECTQGRSWGIRGDRVWVDHGCRSDFEVSGYGHGGGGGGGSGDQGQQQRAESACRNEAKRQFITLTRIEPARNQGTYWRTALYGSLRGQAVQGECRFDPRSNQATVFVQPAGGGGGGGGGGSGGSAQLASRACSDQARRLGYGVQNMATPQAASGGYRIAMTILRGKDKFAASCSYRSSDGRAEIDQVLPQPR
jgi:hypothetical protein